ncbi:MAG: HAMP domain-containing protein [Planctomycetes bacterium]|nr:HAMP domain-containing protein [Planctomycetota bacterium]
MSLRYKALIAVVLLVALLTSFLVVSSSALFEENARASINNELLKDQGILDERITFAAQASRQGMRASAGDQGLVEFLNDPRYGDFRANLGPFAEDWRRDAGGEISLFAVDVFTAEDRNAEVIGKISEDLMLVFISSKEEIGDARRDEIGKDPELIRFMDDFFKPAWNAGNAKDLPTSATAVLPIAGKVYLVVQNYLWLSIQRLEPVGVGVVLTELSHDWLKRSTGDEGVDKVEKIVFAGDIVASSTLDDQGGEIADSILSMAQESGAVSEDGAPRPFEFQYDGETYLGVAFSSELSPKGTPNRPGFVAFKNLDAELQQFKELRTNVSLIGAGLGLMAALLAYFGAYLVISKLRRIEVATGQIREGKFDTRVEIRGRDELARLGKAFNDMTTGLKALGMYTDNTLAKNLLDNPELLNAPSKREEGSIFFSDIKGFTSISEGLSAEDLTSQLNEYFAALGKALRESRGYVDKFIGDSIMAFWGPPFVKDGDYAVRACETAIASFKVAAQLRAEWEQQGKPLFFQRIGIATGEVVIGNIGTQTKKNFTVIGDSVNLASRLEGANKLYGTEVLTDERTYELAKRWILFREVDQIRVVGKSKPVRVFEPLALVGGETATYASEYQKYDQALLHYRAGEFEQAVPLLNELLALRKVDGPAQWLLARCNELLKHKPDDWEPVTTATSK